MPVRITSSRICPRHNVELRQRVSRFGPFWGCPCWPNCDTIGNYSEHDKKFRISNQKTRDARKRAHAAFDPLWQDGWLRRSQGYLWLGERLNLPAPEMHIEYLTALECKIVVNLVAQKLAELKSIRQIKGESDVPEKPVPARVKFRKRRNRGKQ